MEWHEWNLIFMISMVSSQKLHLRKRMQYSVSMYLMAVIMEHNGSSLIFLNAHKPPPLSRSYVTTGWNLFGVEISHLWLLSSFSRDKSSVLTFCRFEYKGFFLRDLLNFMFFKRPEMIWPHCVCHAAVRRISVCRNSNRSFHSFKLYH